MLHNLIIASIGLWIIFSLFLGMSAQQMTVSLVIVGAIVSAIAFRKAYKDYDPQLYS